MVDRFSPLGTLPFSQSMSPRAAHVLGPMTLRVVGVKNGTGTHLATVPLNQLVT